MRRRLGELVALFMKLGATAFGGPAAHIGMMDDQVVSRRGWMSREQFLDLVGATNLIPGPNSTEMTMHVGYHRAERPGLAVAGTSFILPAALITVAVASFYVRTNSIPAIESFLAGVRPVAIALILGAVWRLGKKALTSSPLIVVGLLVSVAAYLGASAIVALMAGALVGMVWLRGIQGWRDRRGFLASVGAVLTLMLAMFGLTRLASSGILFESTLGGSEPTVWQLGLFFLIIGAVLFGSGYVLIAYIEDALVNNLGWLTEQQLLDAVAVGQLTPGPVLTTATFVGYVLAGATGAVVSTVAIFLPAFVYVLVLSPFLPRMRQSVWMSAFLDAVNASAVGLMAAVLLGLSITTLTSWQTVLIAGVATVLFLRFRVSGILLVVGGALAGFLFL